MTDPTPPAPSRTAQALLVGGAPTPEGQLATGPWRLALLFGAVGALGWFQGWGWVFIIAALTLMIFLHELGHFVTAKWAGMKVTEFCILGIGPKIWSMRRGETEYMVRLIPLAAYVRIIGMNNLDDTDPADEPRAFRQQSFPKRVLVMSGGSIMHFVQAIVLFFVVFAFVGVPGDVGLAQDLGGAAPRWGVVEPLEGGNAEKAGIRAGDEIVSIDDKPVREGDDIKSIISKRIGEEVPIVVRRDGSERTLDVLVGRNPNDRNAGFLGVSLGDIDSDTLPSVTVNPLSAVYEAGRTTGDLTWQTLRGLGAFATGGLGDLADSVVNRDTGDDQGPVVAPSGSGSGAESGSSSSADENRAVSIFGIARIGADAAENDLGEVLLLMAVVNISIGLLNMLPLLPLDGGHIAIAVYERVRSRNGRRHMADVSRLLPLTYAVVLLLGMIMLSTVYLDIVDPIGLR